MVVFLKLLPEIAESRVRARSKHFFSPTLVASQFLALENPKEGLCIDASLPIDEILLSIENSLPSSFARR
jgi:gluconate kinase